MYIKGFIFSFQMGVWCDYVHIVSMINKTVFASTDLHVYLLFSFNYRLVGCPPFWHRKQLVMLRNIMEGKYSFSSPEWADITGKNCVKATPFVL